ncbi:biorientation of chromosomes in cell division protein 1-like 1 isoform X3 [Brienomyrus brachyistius]|uniref:biorientation of chromosomes in cell division protein 1-like 1 isoform X3 n=1 Tax=Brienomyrus brachyistius TaxID=42636 RepID=UPI0020B27090|nr:biorientation of chromosomes in cell division protein 1-like 1 isoform X3 [Brienomyrus brachyistius]
MAGLPPGDPQLVSMIVNHLKTQGLFDQFRRDCLADVDTKPAYLNLRQRVDNFVSNHLSNHTWSPHLNKNQLRNNIRQLVLQSGMLEQGVDRIVAQVVDPKIHHTFRPQVEKVVREFLSPGQAADESPVYLAQPEEKQEHHLMALGPSSTPATSTASDAMSILDTITSLNQEANAWTCGERPADKAGRRSGLQGEQPLEEEFALEAEPGELDMSLVEEEEEGQGEEQKVELGTPKMEPEIGDTPEGIKEEFVGEAEQQAEQQQPPPPQQEQQEGEEFKESAEEAPDVKGEDGKDRAAKTPKEEAPARDGEAPSEKQHIRQKARERLKEEYSLEDSDLEGLSDITVSSVHTSDLSSFEEESEEEPPVSDSTEEGEIISEDEKEVEKKVAMETETKERKPRAGRQAYVHKPFLYSRYYSDSDDEVTVEQRRRDAAKDKEERLLKRQQNRERMEEKRRQKMSQQENHEEKMEMSPPSLEVPGTSGKEARKEKKVLEKKVAISRKRRKHSRKEDEVGNKKKGDAEEELLKKPDEMKGSFLKGQQPRSIRKISESAASDEGWRRKSSGESPSEARDPRKLLDRSKTHSFILDLEQASEELLRQRAVGKFDRHPRREQGDMPKHAREKDRAEKERSLSDERSKHKPKAEKAAVFGRSSNDAHMEESSQKDGASVNKANPDEKAEKKSKARGDRRTSLSGRESRVSVSEAGALEEGSQKDVPKKAKVSSSADALKIEKTKVEKVPLIKSDTKLPFCLDSTGSSEDKLDIEPGSESGKKKDKHAREVAKRSKSLTEDKNVEKSRPKSETKDMRSSERDADRKPKMDQASLEHLKPEKPDTDLDHKTRDAESGSKVKSTSTEKSRSKSKEEPKTQPVPKAEKKALSSESKSKSAKISSRSDSSKEKKKDGGLKEDSKASTETLHEKKESRDSKNTAEKLGNDAAKTEEAQCEKKKESSVGVSVSPSVPETPPPNKLQTQEDNMDCEVVGSAATTSTVDDTFDALSDITPELEDDDTAMQIDDDLTLQPASAEVNRPPSPTEEPSADTPLIHSTDKDFGVDQQEQVCNVPQEVGSMELASCASSSTISPEMGQLLPGISLQEADLKMQEAALTLLSMDPDMSVCHSLTAVHPHLPLTITSSEPEQPEAACPPEVSGNFSHEATDGITIAVETVEMSPPKTSQETDFSETVQPVLEGVGSKTPGDQLVGDLGDDNCSEKLEEDEAVGEELENPDKSDNTPETKTEEQPDPVVNAASPEPLHLDVPASRSPEPAVPTEVSKTGCHDVELEVAGHKKEEDVIVPPETGDACVPTEEVRVNAEAVEAYTSEKSLTREGENMQSSVGGEQPGPSGPAGRAEEQPGDAERDGEPSSAAAEDTSTGRDASDHDCKEPQIEDQAEKQQEVKEARRGRPPRLVKQASSASKSDGLEEETGADPVEQEDRAEGRMTRKGRPGQKLTAARDASKISPGEGELKETGTETQEEEEEADDVKETRPRRGRPPLSTPRGDAGKSQKAEGAVPGPKPESDNESEKSSGSKVPRRRRSSKTAPPLEEMRSSSQEPEEDEEEGEAVEGEVETAGTPGRRGRHPGSSKSTLQRRSDAEGLGDTEGKAGEKEVEEKSGGKRGGRRGRVGRPPGTGRAALKRKRSEEVPESGEDSQAEEAEDKSDGAMRPRERLPRDTSASQSDDQEDEKEAGADSKAQNLYHDSLQDEEREAPPEKKPARRGRPPKAAAAISTVTEDTEKTMSERKDKRAADWVGEMQVDEEVEDEEDEETQTRATTRSATRLEAQRNKPPKPSTRALSKLSGKEDTPPATRAGRGQGRKREASPPAVRTRGGQKSEEPPTKRTKR